MFTPASQNAFMEIIPAIYIWNGHCVALYKGSFDQKVTYFKSPMEMVHYFKKEDAKKIHLVDLDGCRKCEFRQRETIERLVKSSGVPIQVESGFKTLEDIQQAFDLGVDSIALRTCGYGIIKAAIAQFGPEKIIVEIHAKGSEIVTPNDSKEQAHGVARITPQSASAEEFGSADSGAFTKKPPEDVVDFAESLIPIGVKNIIYKDERSEGTMIHPNYDEVDRLFLICGQSLRIYVSGGISEVKHLLLLKKIGATGAIIGKAFAEKMLRIKEAERAVG